MQNINIKEPEDFINKILMKFTKKRKLAFLTTLIVGLIVHLQLYVDGLTNPDSLWNSIYYISGEWEVSLGRWGVPIIDTMRGGLVSPIIVSIISIVIMSITAIFVMELFSMKKTSCIVLSSIVLAVSPVFTMVLTYTYCADAYSLAMLFSVISAYLICKEQRKKKTICGASIFLMLSMAIYQSYIGVTCALCVIKLIFEFIKKEHNTKAVFRNILDMIIMGILAVILYYVSAQIALHIYGTQVSSYGGADKIGFDNIRNLVPAIKNCYHTFYEFYFQDSIIKNTFWQRDKFNIILLLIIILNLILIGINNKIYKISAKNKIFWIAILIIILPIAMNVIQLIAQQREINLLMAASLLLTIVFAIKLMELLPDNIIGKLAKWSTTLISIIIIWTYILSDSATYMALKQTQDQAYGVINQVLNRMQMEEEYTRWRKVCFVGTIDNKNYPRTYEIYEMANGCISDLGRFWTGYSSSKTTMQNFLRNYYGISLSFCNAEEYRMIINTEEFKKMEIFPEKNSVKIINDIMVVKFTNNPALP